MKMMINGGVRIKEEREKKNVDQKNTNKENRKLSESNCHTITIQEKIENSKLRSGTCFLF